MKYKFLFAAVLLSTFNLAFSQEIIANVTVDMEQLDQENRVSVSSLEYDLENYINNQKFMDEAWEGERIPVDINIYLTGGARNVYSARLFVISRRHIAGADGGASMALRLIENNWTFEYNRGAMLSYNPLRFNPFSSLIDYYMLLAIGTDMDTYVELSGTKAFEKAKQIVSLGSGQNAEGYTTIANPGEVTKFTIVSELTDPRYEDLRRDYFSYYVDGLDMMAENREQGLKSLAAAIGSIADFKKNRITSASAAITIFFETKYDELAATFKGYDDAQLFEDLMYLDPLHSQKYLDAKESR